MGKSGVENIVVKGSYFEMGFQHGQQCKDAIQAFLSQDFAQINWLKNEKINENDLDSLIAPYLKSIEKYVPEMLEELTGLSHGAEITLNQAVLLQVRRELIGTNGFKLLGDCSSFAFRDTNHYLSGQTIDLNGDMTSLGRVFHIKNENTRIPSIMMYSFAGLIGYMGMNDAGLTVVINLVISNHWKTGISPYLMVRKFLELRTVDECIAFAESVPVASSRSFTISDNEKSAIIELTGNKVGVIWGDKLCHTNHFLCSEFKVEDSMNFFSRNSSVKRLQLMEEHFQLNGYNLRSAKELFENHDLYPTGICAHNDGDVKMNETVAAVIFEPNKGRMHALKGKPCKEQYTEIKFIKETAIYGS